MFTSPGNSTASPSAVLARPPRRPAPRAHVRDARAIDRHRGVSYQRRCHRDHPPRDDTLHVSNLTGSASFNGNTGTDNLFHDAGSDNGFASGFEYIDGVFQQSHGRNPRVASVTNAIA